VLYPSTRSSNFGYLLGCSGENKVVFEKSLINQFPRHYPDSSRRLRQRKAALLIRSTLAKGVSTNGKGEIIWGPEESKENRCHLIIINIE
jgi:hypothetical protein